MVTEKYNYFRFDDGEKSGNGGNNRGKLSATELLVATIRHMKEPRQLLIIPLTLWSGIEQGFFGSDFTAVR